MNKITNSFIVESQKIAFEKNVEFNKIKGYVFKHYGHDDPASLCDGGDYLYNVQIRVENAQGDVYISIQPRERSERWFGTITWKEFHDMILNSVKTHPKIQHHEH